MFRALSNIPGIISPVQHSLPLFPPTIQIVASTILLQLCDVSANGAPPMDLTRIICTTPSHEITAIPLKPTARILPINPSLLFPYGERLRRVYAKAI